MEYGLGPCKVFSHMDTTVERLNPCFNGIWSRTRYRGGQYANDWRVLILVLMEYGLGPLDEVLRKAEEIYSLNPCFNGIWSRTQCYHNYDYICSVLILVLMEYGLGQ